MKENSLVSNSSRFRLPLLRNLRFRRDFLKPFLSTPRPFRVSGSFQPPLTRIRRMPSACSTGKATLPCGISSTIFVSLAITVYRFYSIYRIYSPYILLKRQSRSVKGQDVKVIAVPRDIRELQLVVVGTVEVAMLLVAYIQTLDRHRVPS